jgi:prolyl oligopeptidase
VKDPYLWLEDIDGAAALDWVRERNAEAVARLADGDRFTALRDELRDALDSPSRIPWPTFHGEHLYNFWRDATNPRGLWRRTTLAEYRTDRTAWEVVLDLDRLAREEGENWVWQPPERLRPAGRRCLVNLSRGGSDAAVVREFDLADRTFVDDGFALPEAKSWVHWIDVDRLFVATDTGPGSLTTSGYPRTVREWRRGTPLTDAPVVFEAAPTDMTVYAHRDRTGDHERDFVYHRLDFFRTAVFLRRPSGALVRVDAPEDADVGAHGDHVLIRLRSPWTVAGRTYPSGSLLAAPFEAYLAGERDLTPLFEPDERTSLLTWSRTHRHLVVEELVDVRARLRVLTPTGDSWHEAPLTLAGSDHDQVEVLHTNPDHGDEYLLLSAGFTRPNTLWHGRIGDGPPEAIRQEPHRFDADGIAVRRHFATSADGTRVPYLVVGRGDGPTMLTGYGGFEVPMLPYYDPLVGRAWLARGGTFALANIRGGGEYGPEWHHAARRERRPRAYEDFAAVARDLVDRGLTTPDQLGIEGGSNGGLLTGVMLTSYPELFGAVAISVPLLDMRRYHLLLAGSSWMAEYGDPDDPDDWAFLSAYSPYHNVQSGRQYPPVLVQTSTRDDRVHPGHARKMVALLREHGADVTYYENIEGGHAGAADNEQIAFMLALRFEFLHRTVAEPDQGRVPD